MTAIDELLQSATAQITSAPDLKTLEDYRVQFLGKKGQITEHLKNLGKLSAEERPAAGHEINVVKQHIMALLDSRIQHFQAEQINLKLSAETIDVTLPGRRTQQFGTLHPVTQTRARLNQIFTQMGFTEATGPEIEDDFHNFTALNIPDLHPARAEQDTFYFPDGSLLRTQMSPVQIRVMKATPPPIRIIAMGRVYRRDYDITHTPMFHQIEGLFVDQQVSLGDLKGIMTAFLFDFFEAEVPIRFRSSYFPFTEPSAEVDIGCVKCASKGCRICKNTGWLEVLGCGMVHPNVLRAVEIDPNKYSGFAFGCGIDRLAMLRYGITDLRALFENDLRFLRQF